MSLVFAFFPLDKSLFEKSIVDFIELSPDLLRYYYICYLSYFIYITMQNAQADHNTHRRHDKYRDSNNRMQGCKEYKAKTNNTGKQIHDISKICQGKFSVMQ